MRVTRDTAKKIVRLDQHQHTIEVLKRFGMSDCKSVSTPMSPSHSVGASDCPSTDAELKDLKTCHELCRSIVGSISYAALSTRPDVCTACIICAKYAHNPGRAHLVAAKRILRYLAGTKNLCLTFGGKPFPHSDDLLQSQFDPRGPNNQWLHGYCDANWAGDKDSRKSTSGYMFFLMGGPVSWKSRMQKCIAMSSAESEYIAACASAKEAKWLRLMLSELEPNSNTMNVPVPISCDSQSAIAIVKNRSCTSRTKHIELRYHLVRDYAMRGIVVFTCCPTACNVADLLTKPVQPQILVRLVRWFMRELLSNEL